MAYRKAIKRDKTDAIFSELVRLRTNWTCEYCHKTFEANKAMLHCSHLFGRRSKGTRWHPENAFSHCWSCHRYLEENPPIFAQWASHRLGKGYDRLMLLANKPTKFSDFDKEVLHKHYLSERKRLKSLRESGEIGRIEFCLP